MPMHGAMGVGAQVNKPGASQVINGNTLNAVMINQETVTDTVSGILAAIINDLMLNNTGSTGGTMVGQDGIVEVLTTDTANYTGVVAGEISAARRAGTGTVTNLTAVEALPETAGTNGPTVTTSYAYRAIPLYSPSSATSTVTTSYNYLSQLLNLGTSVVTNSYGFYQANPTNTHTITNQYGLWALS